MPTASTALSKRFAHRLALAIDADCITYRDFVPWADKIIARHERPPLWLCELATTKYKPYALRAVIESVLSDPPEEFPDDHGEFLGFLWIRHERRELSWATFLKEAGKYTDAKNGPLECEYFYGMLNELEEQDFSLEAERRQRAVVNSALEKAIDSAREVYDEIRNNG
jgi:hypothetical protein